ncbi:GH25 family lysozyme [Dactylosporangium sp. CS-033363]|uniref:GH25 family lysozyme n=1 Tax=Dactylosporangium sp. CS-033363 TaxID=3239935 RepID=UPI003D8F9A4C
MSLRLSVLKLARAAVVVACGLLPIAVAGTASAQPSGDGGGHAQGGQAPGVRANAVTLPPVGFPMLGIDVSSHDHANFPIDWPGVASSGTRFAYIKATEGQFYVNSYFHDDYVAAKAAGLLTGAYTYGRPDLGDPVGQANYFIDHAEWVNDSRTLVPFLDMEWPYASLDLPACYGMAPPDIVAWIRGFVDTVKARTGRDMMIYTATSWWNPCTGNDTSFANNPLDLALWGSVPPLILPAGWTSYALWQYASGNPAVAGNYDKDAFNGDYMALTKLAGDVPADGPAFELRAAANNRYVSAANGGNSPLIANRDAIGVWEQYDMVNAGNGDVALRSHSNGQYVTADLGNNGTLIANRPSIGAWERFTVIANADGSMGLFANANGKYVTADLSNGGTLVANRASVGPWEKFTRVPVPTSLALKASGNGKIVTAASGGLLPLVANRDAVGAWERFEVVDLGNGDVALRANANGLYVTADLNNNGTLIANRTAAGSWERFRIATDANGVVTVLALANGKYVTADLGNGAILAANRASVGDWEKFSKAG